MGRTRSRHRHLVETAEKEVVTPPRMNRTDRPRVGVSACLLGDEVRYDGRHKRNAFLIEHLGTLVEWVRVCPEVEVGMGVPREPVHLIDDGSRIRIVTTQTRRDFTDDMDAWAGARLEELARQQLSGYVLKKDSPSCGMDGVRVHDRSGATVAEGRGLFADALIRRFPSLPVEDEGRLADTSVQHAFITGVFEYWRRHYA